MHFKKRSKKKKKRTPEWSKITTKFWFHILEKKKMPPSKGSLLGGSIGWWSRDNLSRDQIDHVNDGRDWEAQGQRGQRVQVSIMTFSAYRQARMGSVPTIDYDVIPRGYVCSTSTVPALGT